MKKSAVTIKDVAERAEVALGTVSRIINGHQSVKPELRAHVLAVIEELGYRPNASARTLRTKRTQAIGIIVTDLRQPVAAELIATASTIARRHGFASIVGEFHSDADREAQLLAFMAERKVDGLLLTLSSDEDQALLKRVEDLAIPVVLWERDAGGRLPSVRSDHGHGTRLAAETLRRAGRTHPLVIAGAARSWTGREQIAGMADFPELRVFHTEEISAEVLADSMPTIDSVVANIHDIPMVLRTLRTMGRRCPEDVALISIGNDPFLEFTAPPITAVRTRPDLVARNAVEILLSQLGVIETSGQERDIIIQPELILRNSV